MARYTHKLIKKTAIGIAHEAYQQECSANNQFFHSHRSQLVWVEKNWKHFIKPARKTLAKMLSANKYDENIKREIYEALLEDRSIPARA